MTTRKKLLVAGASGLVGSAAIRHFATLPDWEVVGVSRRSPPDLQQARIVSLDLMDRLGCAEVLGTMRDVTHVVYAALHEMPGLIPGWQDPEQMRINLTMFQNERELAVDLRHETTHAVLHGLLPMVPLWLDEGLAEYFEAPEANRLQRHPHFKAVLDGNVHGVVVQANIASSPVRSSEMLKAFEMEFPSVPPLGVRGLIRLW